MATENKIPHMTEDEEREYQEWRKEWREKKEQRQGRYLPVAVIASLGYLSVRMAGPGGLIRGPDLLAVLAIIFLTLLFLTLSEKLTRHAFLYDVLRVVNFGCWLFLLCRMFF